MSAVEVTPAPGIDPRLGLHAIRVDLEGTDAAPVDWEAAVARGRVALAHQMAGACRAMLDLARTHAMERTQFGRPIARFQAVRHKLAEALVAVEALDAVLDAAGTDPGPMTAALAKAAAGRTARTVATHGQQVLAGIGFTAEHPFHRYLKRTMVLDGLFGRADDILRDIGHRLLADRHVPTLLEL
jgi:alkylation response protein AidB-like acyl-CoA dehydrogenase